MRSRFRVARSPLMRAPLCLVSFAARCLVGRPFMSVALAPRSLALPMACALLSAPACESSSSESGGGGTNAVGGVAGAGAASGHAGGETGAASGGASGDGGAGGSPTLDIEWDWAGVIGTGQSLAVGDPGSARGTASATVRATTQPFANLKLSTGALPWPVAADDASLALVPLIEPIGRLATGYPSSWPTNIAGETPHAAMANQITSLVQAAGGLDHVGVHSEVGENGQCLTYLVKGATPNGVNGRSFEAALIETRAITRLARAAGKSYGVGAIIVTHGECDAGNANYAAELHRLWADYDAELSTITGQTQPPLLIVSQQNAVNDRSASTLGQWKIGVDYPDDAVCSGPKYQYAYSPDAIHMLVEGYEQLGEKYAQVYFERVIAGRDWRPLQPSTVERDGRLIRVAFHVPVPPLTWEESFQAPHQTSGTEWSAGKGFEVRGPSGNITISSVEIVGETVQITCAEDLPAAGVTVGYAMTADAAPMATPFAGTTRWGQLRDSDPFVGSTTQKAQPNFAVAFELPVP